MPTEFLDHLDAFISVSAFILTMFNLIYFRRMSSHCIAAIGFIIVQALSNVITAPIRDVLSGLYPNFSLVLFYFSFAFIDLVAIVVIYRLHRLNSISIAPATNFCVRCIQFLAVIQVLRYVDRVFGLNLLTDVYRHVVPGVNLSILMVICFSTVTLVLHQKSLSGVKGF